MVVSKHLYAVHGIILKRKNVGEMDKVITLFSKEHGKIRVIGKGVRKVGSRRASGLELFSESIIYLHKGKSWDTITEVTTLTQPMQEHQEMERIHAGYVIAEIVDALLPDNQQQIEVYESLKKIVHLIATGPKETLSTMVIHWIQETMMELGYTQKNDTEASWSATIQIVEQVIERKIRSIHLLMPKALPLYKTEE